MLTHCTFSFHTDAAVQGWSCKALTSTHLPCVHWATQAACHLGAGRKGHEIPGHCIKDLVPSRDINLPGMCIFNVVRCTLLLYQIGLPPPTPATSALLEEVPTSSTGVNERGTQPRLMGGIALLNKKELYKSLGFFFFFPNHKNSPRKSLRYVQIESSKFLYIVYFMMFTYTFHFEERKMQINFLTTFQIFHGTVEL